MADASAFLFGIIGENDIPFIYEKTGNTYSHFFLDEFQDTSLLQWSNLKPLVEKYFRSNQLLG
jgi:ATP-dependent exoDNAse (exonuclease V) beta subunit